MKPMKPNIFIATESDIPAIAAINKKVLRHLKWSYDKKYLKLMVLGHDNGMYWVMRINDVIIGAFHFYIEDEYVWLNTLAIDKTHQKKGYGRMAVEFIEKEALWFNKLAISKSKEVRLWSLKECVGYYEALGYKKFEKDGDWFGMKKLLK